jgi:hypothetical protein
MAKRWRLATLLVVVASAATVLIVCRAWFAGQSFDRAAWQEDATAESGARKAMADRLLARRTLFGKTRAEVVDLLGEPPPTEYFREWDLVYRLGMERGFITIDSEWLVLRMGTDGRVAEARLVTD